LATGLATVAAFATGFGATLAATGLAGVAFT